MDNHRAALWCWLRHINLKHEYGLFHIDAHYDSSSISDDEMKNIPDISELSFKNYLDMRTHGPFDKEIPMIRWDNYLYFYQVRYGSQIKEFLTATHKLGDEPISTTQWAEIHMSQLPQKLDEFLEYYAENGWILNVDLDYFFTKLTDGYGKMHSQYYISSTFNVIKKHLVSGKVICLTICLSPECCGDWYAAEQICYELCDVLEINFRLPELSLS